LLVPQHWGELGLPISNHLPLSKQFSNSETRIVIL
jgi:hypothetical protein